MPQRTSRRFSIRFSLRLLIALVTISGILFAGIGWRLNRAKQQKQILADLRLKMGDNSYYYKFQRSGIDLFGWPQPDQSQPPPVAQWLIDLAGIDFWATLTDIYVEQLSDPVDLAEFQRLDNVELLQLHRQDFENAETIGQFSKLEFLDLSDNPITNISGLSSLQNLVSLNLENTPVEDISALAQLKQLRFLNLNSTKVRDISPLSNLKELEELDIENTVVTNFSALAGKTKLTSLQINPWRLTDDKIDDLSFLAGLINVEWLFLHEVHSQNMGDFRQMSRLKVLEFWSNSLRDISDITHLKELTELDLHAPHVPDISAIGELTNLESLNLDTPLATDVEPISRLKKLRTLIIDCATEDISSFSTLTNLEALYLRNSRVNDLSSVASMPMLTRLCVTDSSVRDVSPLANLSLLRTVSLSNSPVSDIRPLSGLNTVSSLWLNGTKVHDLSPIRKLSQLNDLNIANTNVTKLDDLPSSKNGICHFNKLDLNDNRIEDLTPLSGGIFDDLDLAGTDVTDISSLATTTIHTRLDLSRTRIADVSPLANLKSSTIREIYLRDTTAIRDLSPLTKLPSLRSLYLEGSSIPKEEIARFKRACPMCMVFEDQPFTVAATRNVKADDAPKRSPELEVLSHYVGTWDVEVALELMDGEKRSKKRVSRTTWSLGGGFIRIEDERPHGEPEFHQVWTYDSKAKNYPAVGMRGPSSFEMTGTWDEATKTMTSRAMLPNGNRLVMVHRFVSKDRAEATSTFTNSNGDVVYKIMHNHTRRKANKGNGK